MNFKITTKHQTETDGQFIFEPLAMGFGHTLGNALRRVLLAQLEGAAISNIKINGIAHQFSTISGMVEDVTILVLNLKNVRLKMYSDKPIKMRLDFTGKGEVKAKHIDTQGGAEIINGDLHIAQLTDNKARLAIELTAEKGNGYVLADDRKTNEIGVIPIDSIFSPVILVNYNVEPTRVGRRTDFDKLSIEIKTDGTIKPEEALSQAARILSQQFRQIYEPTFEAAVVVDQPSVSDELLKMSVEELDLPVRITNALKAIDIDTVDGLIYTSKSQLMKAKNLGSKSLSLISEKLLERGLSLREA